MHRRPSLRRSHLRRDFRLSRHECGWVEEMTTVGAVRGRRIGDMPAGMSDAHGRGPLASRSTKTLEATGSRHGRARFHLTEPPVGPARRAGARRVVVLTRPARGGSGAAPAPAGLPTLRLPDAVAL